MFPPVSRRRPPRSTRSHSSKRANEPLLFWCLRTAQKYIWVLLTLAIGSNLVIFLGGDGGVELEAPTLRNQQNVAQRQWAYDIKEPPDGLTCENWLTDVDRVQGGRDFSRDPIIIFAKEPKLYHTCAVGCVLKEAQEGTPCDGELVYGPSSSTERVCTHRVVVQEDPADDLPPQNRSNTVYMTTSLDSDVPIGHPSWADFPLMAPVAHKRARHAAVALLNTDCRALTARLQLLHEFKRMGLKMALYGKCLKNRTAETRPQEVVARYKFALVFEDLVHKDYLSEDYWMTLAAGTVPIVVSPTGIAKFQPADNAFLQVQKFEDVKKVAEWVAFLVRYTETYNEMLRWKEDWPSDTFLALVDMATVPPHCRLCILLATKVVEAAEAEVERPCRCWDAATNESVYHVGVRERGRFAFHELFLRSNDLTVAALIKSVHRLFKALNHKPVWASHRPDALSGAVMLRAFRIYAAAASQDMALQGLAAFRTDDQLRDYVESTPCPKLEVIFL